MANNPTKNLFILSTTILGQNNMKYYFAMWTTIDESKLQVYEKKNDVWIASYKGLSYGNFIDKKK